MKNKILLLGIFSVIFLLTSCSEKDRRFTEFEDLGYGALPRIIQGIDYLGNIDSTGFEFANIENSQMSWTVEMFDENNGANVTNYDWTVAYRDFGPVPFRAYTQADFSPGAEGLPTISDTWTMTEMMTVLGIPADSLQFGFKFDLQGSLTKSDGSVFTSDNTEGNVQGQPVYRAFYQAQVDVDNAPLPAIPFKSDLAGIYDVVTTVTSQDAGIGWDDCAGNEWTGQVEFVQLHTDPQGDGMYNILTDNGAGEFWNDVSIGAYYACYGTDMSANLPGGDLLLVDSDGKLSIPGASQWDEVYSVNEVSVDGPALTIGWTNDYGEGAISVITRTDGTDWPDNLSN